MQLYRLRVPLPEFPSQYRHKFGPAAHDILLANSRGFLASRPLPSRNPAAMAPVTSDHIYLVQNHSIGSVNLGIKFSSSKYRL